MDIETRKKVFEQALEGYRKHSANGAEGIANIMTSGVADGYRIGLMDACEWLRKRGNHGAAADLEKLIGS